ncbi:hypothetical protein [Amycolatopsis methanolica]|uniref:Transmembrane protein n=1 Tax=Amycolatopsis methanolica 239 TaxID=1068978 RepID=A0A076MSQ4_AMYME|nr:hypothetical protein [Amycolatopsis methanolica]AIJ23664.1 Transmembrane protein [Amycolatopsis methanolica 239]
MAELAGGVTCLWLGMVLGISFLEAPLKFRAPGVTVPLGLGIGRIVFRALNRAEVVLAVLVAAGVTLSDVRWPVYLAGAVAAVVLVVQLAVVRPPLNRRSDRVLAGEDVPRSRAHVVYVVLEAVKVLALVALGGLLLTGG